MIRSYLLISSGTIISTYIYHLILPTNCEGYSIIKLNFADEDTEAQKNLGKFLKPPSCWGRKPTKSNLKRISRSSSEKPLLLLPHDWHEDRKRKKTLSPAAKSHFLSAPLSFISLPYSTSEVTSSPLHPLTTFHFLGHEFPFVLLV